MRRLFGCPDIVSLTEKFLMARNFFRIFTENNPVMWDSKTFCIPEAKGLMSTLKPKCCRKSAPNIATGTSAIVKIHLHARLKPKSIVNERSPYVGICVLLTTTSTKSLLRCCLSSGDSIGERSILTSAPVSTRNFEPVILSNTWKRQLWMGVPAGDVAPTRWLWSFPELWQRYVWSSSCMVPYNCEPFLHTSSGTNMHPCCCHAMVNGRDHLACDTGHDCCCDFAIDHISSGLDWGAPSFAPWVSRLMLAAVVSLFQLIVLPLPLVVALVPKLRRRFGQSVVQLRLFCLRVWWVEWCQLH